ncbi:MAG: hypothetical protein LBH70_05745 [Spirochaetaceae bacterium]|nr:hypothetical protein [Spirochaetaceae bacterium]
MKYEAFRTIAVIGSEAIQTRYSLLWIISPGDSPGVGRIREVGDVFRFDASSMKTEKSF